MAPLKRFVNVSELQNFLASEPAVSSMIEDIKHEQVNAIEAETWTKSNHDGSTSPYTVLIFCLASHKLERFPPARATLAAASQGKARHDEAKIDIISRKKDPYNRASVKVDSYKAELELQAKESLQKQLKANKSEHNEILSRIATNYRNLVMNDYAEIIRANGENINLHLGDKAILKMLSLNPRVFKEYQELCTQNLTEYRTGLEAQYLKHINDIEFGLHEFLKSNTGSIFSDGVADGLNAIISKAKYFEGKIPEIAKGVGDQTTTEALVADREKLVNKFEGWLSKSVEDGGFAHVPEEVQLDPIFEEDKPEVRKKTGITEQSTSQTATMVGVPAAILPLYEAAAARAQAQSQPQVQFKVSAAPHIEEEPASSFCTVSAIGNETDECDRQSSPDASRNANKPEKNSELPPSTTHHNRHCPQHVVNVPYSSPYTQHFNLNLPGGTSQIPPSAPMNGSGLYKLPIVKTPYRNTCPQIPNEKELLPQYTSHYTRFPLQVNTTRSSFTPVNSSAVSIKSSSLNAIHTQTTPKRGVTSVYAQSARTQAPRLLLPHRVFQKSRKAHSLVTSNSWNGPTKIAAVDNNIAMAASEQDSGVAVESSNQLEPAAAISHSQTTPNSTEPAVNLDPNTYIDESLYEDPKSPTHTPARTEDPDDKTYPRAPSSWIEDDRVEGVRNVPSDPRIVQVDEGEKSILDSDSQPDDFHTWGDESQTACERPSQSQYLMTLDGRSATIISSDKDEDDGQAEDKSGGSDKNHRESRRDILAAQEQDKVWAASIMKPEPPILEDVAQESFLQQFKGKTITEILASLREAKTGGAEVGADRARDEGR
ncbi:unnamed protein product [Diplocarpon coronariae]